MKYIKINNKNYEIKEANNFFKKLIGFMWKKNFNYGIYFPKVNSIHTFFMKENIDVIGLDNENIIIYKAINIPKNKVLIINNNIKKTSILEMPAFSCKDLKINQKLTFISK